MKRPRILRWLATAGLLAAVLPGPSHAFQSLTACAVVEEGMVAVRVVIDPGDLDPGGPEPQVECVVVAEGETGADVLAVRARALALPLPRYEPSGLLCAIDGRPEDGCGEQVGAKFRYWSYWHGEDGAWTYADGGPAGQVASQAVTEGWHFVTGAAQPSDPPPRAAPDGDGPVLREAPAGTPADETDTRARASSEDGGDSPSNGAAGAIAGVSAVVAVIAVGWWAARRRDRS